METNTINQIDWDKAYSIDAYPFSLIQVITDFFFLEPNGYLVISDSNTTPMDEDIEKIIKKVAILNPNFNISGGGVVEPLYKYAGSFKALSGNWKPKELKKVLYFIQLTKGNVETLVKELNIEKSEEYGNLAFFADWVSYFKGGHMLIDVVHANDGCNEQMHLSKKLLKSKVIQLFENKGLKVNNT